MSRKKTSTKGQDELSNGNESPKTAPGTTETAIVPLVSSRKELVLEGDPEAQLEYAGKAASALMSWVEKKPKKVIINGKQYLEYGSWQILARFFGATAGVEWTKKIEENGKMVGYEARAIVYQHGIIISSAEASCMKTERNWSNRDEFAIKSMAQTRASAKALRNAFGWVAEMAGYASTPAEEMDGVEPQRMEPYKVERKIEYRQMDESNDTHGLEGLEEEPETDQRKIIALKMDIANILKRKHNYTVLSKKPEEIAEKVLSITGFELKPENYMDIIEAL